MAMVPAVSRSAQRGTSGMIEGLAGCFTGLEDPRETRGCDHRLVDILLIAVCAVVARAESWEDIALCGHRKQVWLETFLALPNGITSHDTFRRVFMLLDPGTFERRACRTQVETRLRGPEDLTATSSQGTPRRPMMRSRAPTAGRHAMDARHSWPMSMFRVPAGGPRGRRAGVRTAVSPVGREEHPRFLRRPRAPGSPGGTAAPGRRDPRRAPAHAGPCARPGRPSPAPSGRRRAAQTGAGWRSTAPWT